MARPPAIPFRDLLDLPFAELARRALRPVRVAVLDTGIDASHEALSGRVARATAWRRDGRGGFAPAPLRRGENNDPCGHGTGVAGVIAAFAPNAVLEDVRVLDADGGGHGAVVLEGLRRAVEGDAEIVNVSVAFARDRHWAETSRLLEEAYVRGRIVVAARRNVPRPGDLGLPAELPTAVSVDAGRFGDPFLLRYFPHARIEFAARGEDVATARAGGGRIRLSGTSLATSAVAAICALLRGANPGLSLFEIKTLLKHHAVR